jgi:hypothetical protein
MIRQPFAEEESAVHGYLHGKVQITETGKKKRRDRRRAKSVFIFFDIKEIVD